MKKIKLGIIGTGLAAKNLHLPALLKLKDKIEIAAVCNHTEKKAMEFSKLAGGVPYYLDYNEMLKNPNIDAVDIALPIDLNYRVTIDAFKAGKHVILEKPLAVSLNEAEKLLKAEKKYGVVSLIAENFRYRKVFAKANQLFQKSVIGSPYSLAWNLYYNVDKKNSFAKTKWRKFNKYPGGFLLDAGVHNIAAIRYLFGEFKSVAASVKTINPEIGTHDTMTLQFELQNGMNGVYNIYFSVKGHWEDQLLIFGTRGTIQILNNKLIVKREGKPEKVYDMTDDNGYYNEFFDFYNGIVNKKKIFSGFDEGYKDLLVVLKSFESADLKKRIIL